MMLRCLLAISSNTFRETLRQPVYAVVVGTTMLLLILSPALAMFTLDDDNKLLIDIGLSTLLVAGLFLAVFASATVVTEEIENKTVLTVITKTVSRFVFVLGKFLGIAAAVIIAQYFLSLVFFMVVRHGVLEKASDKHDFVVIILGSTAFLVVFIVGLAGNYFYHWRFSSTAILLSSVLGTIVMGILIMIDPEWKFNPAANHIDPNLLGPIVLTIIATLILTSISVAVATRFGLVMTMIICILFFILGAGVHYWLGPLTSGEGVAKYLAWVGMSLIPSINIYVVTNAIQNDQAVPLIYIGHSALYALFYVCAALMFAIALFRTREIS
ncbi:MAG: hypothetical protein JW860_07800 [Sedimentisphaerales bacterium]|nr:hypothetical protein [Sedimentisphaerales bacterium]